MEDTPIYDALDELHMYRNFFQKKAESLNSLPFDISDESYVRLRDSLMSSTYESLSRSQELIFHEMKDGASIFNQGILFALRVIEGVLDYNINSSD